MKRSLLAAAFLLAAPAVHAQSFNPVIGLEDSVDVAIRRDWSDRAEKVWCVTNWVDSRKGNDTQRMVTNAYLESAPSTKSSIPGFAGCRDSSGKAMPTLHSHPQGTCQANSNDYTAMAARGALFDGILCAPGYHAWYFSKDIIALWGIQEDQKVAANP